MNIYFKVRGNCNETGEVVEIIRMAKSPLEALTDAARYIEDCVGYPFDRWAILDSVSIDDPFVMQVLKSWGWTPNA